MSDEVTPEVVVPEHVTPEQNWLLSMPEELQNDPTLNQYKSVEAAARGFIETKRMVGDRVKIPDETASQEEHDKFYARLGRPDTVTGYELSKVDLPASMQIDEKAITGFKETAFKLGLSKKQADGIYVSYLNTQKEMSAKILADYETGVAQQLEVLKDRWGDKYESNRNLAVNAFKHFASPNLQATVEREGWGNNPDFVELFQKIGVATSEDVMRSGGGADYAGLDEKINAINLKLSKMDQGDIEYKSVITERERLYNAKYPEKSE